MAASDNKQPKRETGGGSTSELRPILRSDFEWTHHPVDYKDHTGVETKASAYFYKKTVFAQ